MKDWAKKAVERWGAESQLRMLQEECGELVVAVSKYLRRREDSFYGLAEEIADVEIMLEQIKGTLFVGLDQRMIQSFKRKKIARLKSRLGGDA